MSVTCCQRAWYQNDVAAGPNTYQMLKALDIVCEPPFTTLPACVVGHVQLSF